VFEWIGQQERNNKIKTQTRIFYGYIIVGITFLTLMLVLGLQGSFGLFFEPLTKDLGWTRTAISGAYSLAQIVYGIFGIVIGLVNDRFGPRVAVTLCGASAGLGCLLMSQVNSIWQIYLFYGILFGIGNAVFVPLLSTIAKWFVKRRSMMSGIAFAGAGFGMLAMPLVVSWIISAYDWRLSFVIVGITILVIAILAAVFLRSHPGQVGQTAYGEEQVTRNRGPVKLEGLTFKQALRTVSFWLMGLIMICYGFSFVALQVHVVPYASDAGLSAVAAASILTVMGGATIIGQIGMGIMGDRIGYKRAYLLGLALIALAILTIIFSRDLWAFYLFAILLGLAFGDCGAVSSPNTAWLFGLASHGLFLGILSFCFTIGGAIGPLVFAYIFDASQSYSSALWVSAMMSIAAVALMFFVRKSTLKAGGKKG
jgi:MFS family permease